MRLDHVFICCDVGAPEADALRRIGFVEGSPNVHPGQGTANRRFFFEVGFLELLWVADPTEAQSAQTAPTRLWPRWLARDGGACPFGAVFAASSDRGESPPFDAWDYRPSYLPAGRSLRFAVATTLSEPELVYMPWQSPARSSQPTRHAPPFSTLRAASFGIPSDAALSPSALAARAAGLVDFYPSTLFELTLELDAARECRVDLRPTLSLILIGKPER